MDENERTQSPWPICMRVVAAFAVVMALLTLAGCGHTPEPRIVTKVVERRIEVPTSLLECMDEPQARELWKTQRDMVLHMERLALAGQDCRTRLSKVRKLLQAQ